MIQDIFPHIYHNEYRPVEPDDESFVMYYDGSKVLASHGTEDGGELDFPRFKDLLNEEKHRSSARYLFSIDGIGYYLIPKMPALMPREDGKTFEMESIDIFRQTEPLYQCFAGITGHQLYLWYRDNLFCGRCGREMEHSDRERAMVCPDCMNTVYPKISPAVIVAVLDGDRILMTKYAGRGYKRYALIAGFNEIGESMEATVKREVMEEVGVAVKNIRYYKSQPWAFSSTMLMGYYCDLDGSDEIRLDTDELSVGEWIRREDIPETDPRISLTNDMIVRFKNGEE